jgi:sulfate adenylyltransferase subunit 1
MANPPTTPTRENHNQPPTGHTPPGGLLRLATAGSVDDGKSTLVGRLLHDTKTVFADQLEAVERTSRQRGLNEADLALLTDGLRAEREQGITIDVAYRYFATPRRRFILADTPGHIQYTRNMITGASTAHLAVILTDARTGIVEQTRRHLAIAALLGVPHVALAVNKMDLVNHNEHHYTHTTAEADHCATALHDTGLPLPDITAIPISALHGDNIVEPSHHMPWYFGPTLLEHLEDVPLEPASTSAPGRLPVQYVIRHQNHGRADTHPDYRGYAGQIASGHFSIGDEVVVAPSGGHSTITGIDVLGQPAEMAREGQSVALRLADHLDVSRGHLIAPAATPPHITRDITATICHLADKPLHPGDRVLIKHTTHTVKAIIRDIPQRLDITTLRHTPNPNELTVNDIATVVIATAEPLAVDDYADNRHTGAFLVIDENDGNTLAAGMIGTAPHTESA